MNINFNNLSLEELRDYVRYNPQDTKAFHTLMDRLEKLPKIITRTDEEFEKELLKRINNI